MSTQTISNLDEKWQGLEPTYGSTLSNCSYHTHAEAQYHSGTKAVVYVIAFDPLVITEQRLRTLLRDENEYDENFLMPTPEAYERALSLIEETRENTKSMNSALAASPAPIGDGGIFIQWGDDEDYVRLLIPPDPKDAYIFRKKAESNEIVKDVNGRLLSSHLQYLATE